MQTNLKLIALFTFILTACPAIANEDFESQNLLDPSVDILPGGSPNGKGMAVAKYFPQQASLGVMDTPLSYRVPVGPSVDFSISYNSARNSRPIGALSNLGPGWSFNWVSFVSPAQSKSTVLNRSGITETFLPKTSPGKTRNYTISQMTRATLHELGLNKFERRLPDGSKEVFDLPDETGRVLLTKIVDSNGIACSVSYDAHMRVSHITDALGQKSTIQYLSEQQDSLAFYKVRSITDPFGRKAVFSYDANSVHLISSTDAIGIVSEFSYEDGSQKMSSLKTPYGTTAFRHYVPKSSPIQSAGLQITLPNGEKSVIEHWAGSVRETYVWDREAIKQFPTDPENKVLTHCSITNWNRDAKTGQEIALPMWMKSPLESPVYFTYEGQSSNGFAGRVDLPISIRRKISNGSAFADQITRFEYNASGQITKETDPLGRSTSYKYAANNIDLLEARAKNNDLLGHWEYDKSHRPILFIDCSGNRTKYEYNRFGQLTKLIDPSNNNWTQEYDHRGFLLRTYGPGKEPQIISTFTYDKLGRVASETDSAGHKTTYAYDEADRIIGVTYGDGSEEQLTYDRLDIVRIKDRAGQITKRTFDRIGQLTSMENSLGAKTSYTWCSCGSRMSVTDPLGHTTSWKYDLQGRIVAKTFPDGTSTTFTYEKNGHRLSARTDALNQTTHYAYNIDDTVKKISYSNTVNPMSSTEISYDQNYPMAISVKTELDTAQFSYYPMIKSPQDQPVAGGGLLHSIASTDRQTNLVLQYDHLGRIIKRTVGNSTVSWAYDNLGRLQTETNALGTFKYDYVTHKGTTSLTSISYPNGLSCKYRYDDTVNQNLTSISATGKSLQPFCEFQYKYASKSGELVQVKELIEGKSSADIGLAYDSIGQLLEYKVLSAAKRGLKSSHSYTYDPATNRISSKSDSHRISALYNSLNQLTTVQSTSANSGDKESSPSITKIEYDANGNLLSEGDKKYKWDAENRLIGIEYPQEDAYTSFSYNALGQRAEVHEIRKGKTISKKKLFWNMAELCKELNTSDNTLKEFFSFGELNNGKKFYFVLDQLGSPRTVTDQESRVVSRLDYEPYGSAKILQGSYEPSKQYAGYYAHQKSKLFLTLCRAYDSKTSRWLSRDPLGEEAGLDLYTYVANNPVSFLDPLGLQSWRTTCGGQSGQQNSKQSQNQNTWKPNSNSLLYNHPANNQAQAQRQPLQQNVGGLNMPGMANTQGYRYNGMLPPGVNAPGMANTQGYKYSGMLPPGVNAPGLVNTGQGSLPSQSYSVGGDTFVPPSNGYAGQNKTSPLVPLSNALGQTSQSTLGGYGNMNNNKGNMGNGINNTNTPQGGFGSWRN